MTGKEAETPTPEGKELYKSLIDHIVETVQSCVTANRIRAWGHSERVNTDDLPYGPQEERRVVLFAALSDEQREIVADLLEDERQGAAHDSAALFEWLTTSQDLRITWHGQVLPDSPFGSYHYDLVCRLSGDRWPDERETERH